MGTLEGRRDFHFKLTIGKTTLPVEDATMPSLLEIAYIQTARQRLEDRYRTKMRLRHDQRPSSSRKHWASACRHYRFLGNNWRNFFVSLFSRRRAAVQKSISRQRPIALAGDLRHCFTDPKTRCLHKIGKTPALPATQAGTFS